MPPFSSSRDPDTPILEAEAGVTDISLNNAKKLARKQPLLIIMHYTRERWWCVDVTYADGTGHTFTGFTWGYGGTGSRGFRAFLESLNAPDSVITKALEVPAHQPMKHCLFMNGRWYAP